MALTRFLNWNMFVRALLLVLGSTVLGLHTFETYYIILDGHHTANCWFLTDMNACRLGLASASLTVIFSASFLVLEILVDPGTFRAATRSALWVETFFSGQLALLWTATFVYLTVQWIRTVVHWPYIKIDHYEHVCPGNRDEDDCSIPECIHVAAIFVLLLSMACTAVWGLYFRQMKLFLTRTPLAATNPLQEAFPAVEEPAQRILQLGNFSNQSMLGDRHVQPLGHHVPIFPPTQHMAEPPSLSMSPGVQQRSCSRFDEQS